MAREIYCDRCGTAVVKKQGDTAYPIVFMTVSVKKSLHDDFHTLDICDECRRDFYKWFTGELYSIQ